MSRYDANTDVTGTFLKSIRGSIAEFFGVYSTTIPIVFQLLDTGETQKFEIILSLDAVKRQPGWKSRLSSFLYNNSADSVSIEKIVDTPEYVVLKIGTRELKIYTPESLTTHTHSLFHSYSNFGVILGVIAKTLGLLLRPEGLYYELKEDGVKFGEILISTEVDVIYRVLGFRYNYPRYDGSSSAQLFNLVIASDYFNKESFLSTTLPQSYPTSELYDSFVRYLLIYSGSNQYGVIREGEGGQWIDEITSYNAGFIKQCRHLTEVHKVNKLIYKRVYEVANEVKPGITEEETHNLIGFYKLRLKDNFSKYILSSTKEVLMLGVTQTLPEWERVYVAELKEKLAKLHQEELKVKKEELAQEKVKKVRERIARDLAKKAKLEAQKSIAEMRNPKYTQGSYKSEKKLFNKSHRLESNTILNKNLKRLLNTDIITDKYLGHGIHNMVVNDSFYRNILYDRFSGTNATRGGTTGINLYSQIRTSTNTGVDSIQFDTGNFLYPPLTRTNGFAAHIPNPVVILDTPAVGVNRWL